MSIGGSAGLRSLSCGWAKMIPSGLETIRYGLTAIRNRLGGGDALKGKTVVIVSDTCWSGTVPLVLGADLPQGFEDVQVKFLGISLMPLCWATPERPPWGSGLPYDISDRGIRRNIEAYSEQYIEGVEEIARWMLEAVNSNKCVDELYDRYDTNGRVRHSFLDTSTICHDVVLQVGLPSFEFKSVHDPPHIKYCGSLPPKPIRPDLVYPEWWTEVEENSSSVAASKTGRKRIVFVAQGTEVLDHSETVIPCIRGLAGRQDTLVIVVLCQKGATLEQHMGLLEDRTLPSNARVIDYFPYDAVLAHADIFVSNSGYGGVGHAIANSVPLVQCGSIFDKADIGRRVEYSGLGVYLPDQSRTPEAIAAAVEEVLKKPEYKRRAWELKAESQTYNPFEIVEREILALSSSSHKEKGTMEEFSNSKGLDKGPTVRQERGLTNSTTLVT